MCVCVCVCVLSLMNKAMSAKDWYRNVANNRKVELDYAIFTDTTYFVVPIGLLIHIISTRYT